MADEAAIPARTQPELPSRETVAHEVLVHAMRHKERRATERLFRLLGLLYPEEDFTRIHRGFVSQDPREHASSVELLENVVAAPLNLAPCTPSEAVNRSNKSISGGEPHSYW